MRDGTPLFSGPFSWPLGWTLRWKISAVKFRKRFFKPFFKSDCAKIVVNSENFQRILEHFNHLRKFQRCNLPK